MFLVSFYIFVFIYFLLRFLVGLRLCFTSAFVFWAFSLKFMFHVFSLLYNFLSFVYSVPERYNHVLFILIRGQFIFRYCASRNNNYLCGRIQLSGNSPYSFAEVILYATFLNRSSSSIKEKQKVLQRPKIERS